MTKDGNTPSRAADRKQRVAEELRANLVKRRQQARSRKAGQAEHRSGTDAQVDSEPAQADETAED